MPVLFIGNIPPSYHSKDLRSYFSEYIENKSFLCFHYRHRVVSETIKQYLLEENQKNQLLHEEMLCTFCEIHEEFTTKFIKKFNNSNWFNHSNVFNHTANVLITPITNITSINHIKSLIEFRPPTRILPQGNVGTPLEFFKKAINNCQMPIDVLKKLGICDSLLIHRSDNSYGKVPLDYKDIFCEETIASRIPNTLEEFEGPSLLGYNPNPSEILRFHEAELEEWERYEALHNDVHEQDRTKPRLYENEMEIVWEKGGSGLVFHTDDATWKALEGKMDFDEDTADDWDVDTEIYVSNVSDVDNLLGNTPEGQLINIKIMQDLKKGIPPVNLQHPTTFKISKFALNQMRKYGWQQGDPLGKNKCGIKSPIVADYRHPEDKSGIGSSVSNEFDEIGLKNFLHLQKVNKPKKHFIRTKFDPIHYSSNNYYNNTLFGSTPWRGQVPSNIKYLNRKNQ